MLEVKARNRRGRRMNTDYILTKKENYERALEVLAQTGYEIV